MKTMLATQINLTVENLLNKVYHNMISGEFQSSVIQLMSSLKKILDAVGSDHMNTEIKDICINHPISKIIFQDPCTYRSFSKPEGYAGDAHLIDFIYRLSTFSNRTSAIGRKLFTTNTSSSSTESVRWRATHLADLIDETYETKGEKIKVLSVASGRCRELAYVEDTEMKIERFICLDQDEKSNEIVRKNYPHDFLYVLDESIMFLLKEGLGEQKFDFIYSAGLFDYLEKKLAARLIQKMYKNLDEKGHMLIPNFAPGLFEQGYMETFMDWKLIYRTEEEMMELAELAGIEEGKVSLYRDPMFNVIYMKMVK